MGIVPPFDERGLLPPGDHAVTLRELEQSRLVRPPDGEMPAAGWDEVRRARLVRNLRTMTRQLQHAGIRRIFIDGSFVEDTPSPNDIDGSFECPLDLLRSGELEQRLNRVDPHRCWTWDPARRTAARGSMKRHLPMWHRYRVELYPHVPGLLSGIRDEHGHELEFPAAFRRSRDGRPRGILRLDPDPEDPA